jgi:hypothetical protein
MAHIEAIASQLEGPVDQLVLSDCRHSPYLDRYDATSDATAQFVRDARASQLISSPSG